MYNFSALIWYNNIECDLYVFSLGRTNMAIEHNIYSTAYTLKVTGSSTEI